MFQKKKVKANWDGKSLIPLSVEAELLEIRKEVEKKVIHAGRNLEIVKQAYNEILNAQGRPNTELKSTCSSCVIFANQILTNWLRMYDTQGFTNGVAKPFVEEPIIPIKEVERTSDKPKTEYALMMEKFNSVATSNEKATINNGNRPSSKQLKAYFNISDDGQ